MCSGGPRLRRGALIPCGSGRMGRAGSARGTARNRPAAKPSTEPACELPVRNCGEFCLTDRGSVRQCCIFLRNKKIGFVSRWASWKKVVQVHLAFRTAGAGRSERTEKNPKGAKLMKLTWANRWFSFSICCFQLSSSQIYISPCFIFFKA